MKVIIALVILLAVAAFATLVALNKTDQVKTTTLNCVQPGAVSDPPAIIAQTSPFLGIIPDLEYIPLYPTATYWYTDSRSTYVDETGERRLTYEVPAGRSVAVDYYAKELPKFHWRSFDNQSIRANDWELSSHTFYWPDVPSSSGWYIQLDISFSHLQRKKDLDSLTYESPEQFADLLGQNTITETTSVMLTYRIQPDLESGLLIYPGASNVSTECIDGTSVRFEVTSMHETAVRTITRAYSTDANPSDVLTYYQSNMEKLGWRASNIGGYNTVFKQDSIDASQADLGNMMFFWELSHRIPNGKLRGADVRIVALPSKEGGSDVRITAVEIDHIELHP